MACTHLVLTLPTWQALLGFVWNDNVHAVVLAEVLHICKQRFAYALLGSSQVFDFALLT